MIEGHLICDWIASRDMHWAQGVLRGSDQMTNLILEQASERLFSEDHLLELVPLGLYIIRGDNMYVVDVACEQGR
jgi:U6 snRNA-associated Sm-like protein LSm8